MFKIRNPKAEIQTPNTKLQEENQKVARRNPKKSGNKFKIRFFLGNPKIFDKIQRNCLFRFTQMMQPLACKSQFWEAVNHPISTTPLCKGEADSRKSQLGSFDPEHCQVFPRSATSCENMDKMKQIILSGNALDRSIALLPKTADLPEPSVTSQKKMENLV